jgi:tetratricopeptide (TPR) repeat protein
MGDWERAGRLYTAMLATEEFGSATTAQQRAVFHGLGRCSYETGQYDKAITALEIAMNMNRAYPGVHKYSALAHKELGRLEEAVKIMTLAVFHETPWRDEENQAENMKLYNELVACCSDEKPRSSAT